jgi:tRNA dimethylallyltransferase
VVPQGLSREPGGPLVLILGPTASGKTDLALTLADRGHTGEVAVVGCDSMQVYRHLDIGTAKPSAAERRRLHHHLVDVAYPDEPFNAGLYARLADAAIAEERQRGRLPLVVGGTGLYVRALLHGLADVPEVPESTKESLAQRLARDGLPALYELLQAKDPVLAARLEPSDTQRILRGLEVFLATGQPLSSFQSGHGFRELRYEPLLLALLVPRDVLYARIEARVRAMVDQGLEDEVRSVLARGYDPTCKPLQAPGYREVVARIEGRLGHAEMVEEITKAHRRYAKRQLTWFRGLPNVRWISPADPQEVEAAIAGFLGPRFGRSRA